MSKLQTYSRLNIMPTMANQTIYSLDACNIIGYIMQLVNSINMNKLSEISFLVFVSLTRSRYT